MGKRRWAGLVGLGVALLAVVSIGVWPDTSDGYRSTVESRVQDAVSSTGTARLAGLAALRGHTFGTYESVVLEDAGENLATAVTDVIELPLTGQDTRRLRDEVLPLLQDSARIVGDLDLAMREGAPEEISTCVAGLAAVGERLSATLERMR